MNSLRPEIDRILHEVGLGHCHPDILQIAGVFESDRLSALRDLILIDQTIPGLGQHNVNQVVEGEGYTGVYRTEDRPIFRSFQYMYAYLQRENLEWFTRDIVTVSCLHVESSLKRILDIEAPLSIGMILRRNQAKFSETDMGNILWDLNNLVYNNAKHTIEDIDIDAHMFSITEQPPLQKSPGSHRHSRSNGIRQLNQKKVRKATKVKIEWLGHMKICLRIRERSLKSLPMKLRSWRLPTQTIGSYR